MNQVDQRKTAFVLGGGGARGAYEIGVWQGLRELGIKIDLVTGSSVGAINGAMVVQDAFDLAVSLWKELDTSMVFDIDIKDIITNNGVNCSGLKDLIQKYVDEDAVRQSPIDYGLVTVEFPSMNSDYLMKEHIPGGKIADYILASAACFPATKSYKIGKTSFIDGAYSDILPVGMAVDKGATHIIAVDLDAIGNKNKKKMEEADYLRIIHCNWDLGSYLRFDREIIKRNMRLGYLDSLKSYEVYDGDFYCFVKGEFTKRSMKGADSAGRIFELDPKIIYKKFIFNRYLKDQLDAILNTNNDLLFNSKSFKDKVFGSLEKIKSTLNQKTLTIVIAKSLKYDKDEKNIFLSKAALRLFNDEIIAANYLIADNLL